MEWHWRQPRTYLWLAASFIFVVAAAFFLFLPIRGSNLITGTAGWESQGCFRPDGIYPAVFFDRQITAHERVGVSFWGSFCGNDASTGSLRSPVFQAPVILEIFVSGYVGDPNRPGLQLLLEKSSGGARMLLPLRQLPGEAWVKRRWWLPKDWRGRQVRLIAIDQQDGGGGWLGVSNPRRVSVLNFFRQQTKSWTLTMADYLFQTALFLIPGLAAAAWLKARLRPNITATQLVTIVVCTGAALGYVSFWAFFFSKGLGQFFTFAVYAAAVILLFAFRETIKLVWRQIRLPFVFTILAGLCYSSFYFMFNDPYTPGVGYVGDRFSAEILAADNVIPWIFAAKIYDHKPLQPFCCIDWLSSDRPPLQAGIALLERPIAPRSSTENGYQLLSSSLQCVWICGVWCLLTSLNTDARRIRQILGFLIFSGFLFYNSVFGWPKLLAASLILFVLSLLFDLVRDRRAATDFEVLLGAALLGSALMAHPGSTFSLAAFGVLLVRLRHSFSFRQIAMAAFVVIAFYLPWSLYQKYVDPPGNRLLKMHLGGFVPVDSRTTWQTIRDSYTTHPVREVLYYKWLNVTYLAGKDFFDSYGLTDLKGKRIDHAKTEISRKSQRIYMWNAAGLVNFGWLAGLYLIFRRRAPKRALWLIAAGLANLLFWSVITFGPYETQTAHSSYADLFLISIGLLMFLLELPRVFYWLLLAWQLWNFFVVWVWSAPARLAQPITLQGPMIVSGVVTAIALLWLTLRSQVDVSSSVWISRRLRAIRGRRQG